MISEDKYYAFIKSTRRINKRNLVLDSIDGAAVGAGVGILAKGLHNKIKKEKFFKGAGKAALIGGGIGAVAGGVNNINKQRKSLKKDLSEARELRTDIHKMGTFKPSKYKDEEGIKETKRVAEMVRDRIKYLNNRSKNK